MRAHSVFRFLSVLLLALVVTAPAHARVFVSFGFPFFPFYGPAYYYPPPAYSYPPPYYYPPQQGYNAYPPQQGYNAYPPQQGYNAYPPQQGYNAPDAYAQSAPGGTGSPSASSGNCRTFHGDATIDASGRPFHGRACLESDGRWHVTQ